MFGYIYKTINLINGKIYVGQKKADHFLGPEYLGSGIWFKKALKKYGKENFEVELLCECDSQKDLNDQECYFISFYNSMDPEIGYNLSEGGQGGRNVIGMEKNHVRSIQKFEELLNSIDVTYFVAFYHTHGTQDILDNFNLTSNQYRKLIKHLNLSKTKEEINNIIKNSFLEKYGVDNIFKSEDFKKHTEKVKEERYGDPKYSNRTKYKETCLERYGTTYALAAESVKQKTEQTLIEKYGSLENYHTEQQKLANETKKKNKENNPNYFIDQYNKTKETLIDKYGSLEAARKDMTDKTKKTLSARYGVNNPSQLPSHKEKCKAALKGKKWYNNGIETKAFFADEVPEGWTPGRMKSKRVEKENI